MRIEVPTETRSAAEIMEGYRLAQERMRAGAVELQPKLSDRDQAKENLKRRWRRSEPDRTWASVIVEQLSEQESQEAELRNARRSLNQPTFPTCEAILTQVAKYFGISKVDLMSFRRTKVLIRPRQIVMYLCRKFTIHSYPEIARWMCDRDHTTVLHGVNVIEQLVRTDPSYPRIVADIVAALREDDFYIEDGYDGRPLSPGGGQ